MRMLAATGIPQLRDSFRCGKQNEGPLTRKPAGCRAGKQERSQISGVDACLVWGAGFGAGGRARWLSAAVGGAPSATWRSDGDGFLAALLALSHVCRAVRGSSRSDRSQHALWVDGSDEVAEQALCSVNPGHQAMVEHRRWGHHGRLQFPGGQAFPPCVDKV